MRVQGFLPLLSEGATLPLHHMSGDVGGGRGLSSLANTGSKKLGMAVNGRHPSTAEAGGSRVQGHFQL